LIGQAVLARDASLIARGQDTLDQRRGVDEAFLALTTQAN
jgi:hypothetical protein